MPSTLQQALQPQPNVQTVPSMQYANPQGGGGVDPQLAIAGNGYDPNMVALLNGQGTPGLAALQPNPAAQQLQNTGSQLLNSQGDIPGALTQFKSQRDAAAQQKMDSINNAIAILQASGARAPGATNIPLLMASGALMSGGVGPGAELSKAALAGGEALQNQRALQQQQNLALGQLGVEAGSIPLEQAQNETNQYLQNLKLGEEFTSAGGQENVRSAAIQGKLAGQVAGDVTREQVAQIQAGARLSAAQIGATKGAIKYLGRDPADPTQGVYLNATNGNVVYGPAADQPSADSKTFNDAIAIARTQNVDLNTALGMARAGTGMQNATVFQKAVSDRENIIRQTPQGATMTPEQLADTAREQVIAEQQMGHGGTRAPAPPATPAPGTTTGGAASPPPPPKSTAPPAAIQMLQKNPSAAARQQFDQVFGQGAAAQALGK